MKEKKVVNFSFRIDRKTVQLLSQLAKLEGVGKSEFLRRCVQIAAGAR